MCVSTFGSSLIELTPTDHTIVVIFSQSSATTQQYSTSENGFDKGGFDKVWENHQANKIGRTIRLVANIQ